MAEIPARVTLAVDVRSFLWDMWLAGQELEAFAARLRHHLPEHPARSAMHAAYDRRRRARRRRGRR